MNESAGKKDEEHSEAILAKEKEDASASDDMFGNSEERASTSFALTAGPSKQTVTSPDVVMNAIMDLSSEFKEFKRQGHISMAFSMRRAELNSARPLGLV